MVTPSRYVASLKGRLRAGCYQARAFRRIEKPEDLIVLLYLSSVPLRLWFRVGGRWQAHHRGVAGEPEAQVTAVSMHMSAYAAAHCQWHIMALSSRQTLV